MLILKTIHTFYGKALEAVRGVSLEVRTGEIVSLIGANGAGKSTLLKSIAGLLPVQKGSMHFDGTDITGWATHRIAELGMAYVPEGRHIFPRLTVRENLLMGAYARRGKTVIKGDLERMWELFPVLKERQTQWGSTLSGGEQQMLAIGRALMGRPKLLMLDEPSMGLAPLVVERIFQLIAHIHAQGTTILMVEQNARKALALSSRGYVLETGKIVLEDRAERLMTDPQVQKAYLGIT